MMWSLVVVVVVAAKDAQGAQAREMTRELEAALKPGSVVVLRESLGPPEDDDLGALAQAVHADAVAAVTWTDSDGRRVRLHVRRTGDPSTAVRELEFKSSDPSIERARAAAFAIAAMVPGDEPSATALPSPPAVERAVEPRPATPPSKEAERPWALQLALVGMLGASGDAPGLGGDLAVRRRFGSVIDAGAALSLTRGDMSAAQATFTLVRPRVGVGVEILQRGDLSFTARVEAGPWLHGVASYSGPASSDSRWVFGTSATGEVAWSVTPAFGLALDGSMDVASGTTRVLVGGEERTSIPAVRLVIAPGVRLRF
jgi:hypothetical protein